MLKIKIESIALIKRFSDTIGDTLKVSLTRLYGKKRCLIYWSNSFYYIWAASRPNQQNVTCTKRRLRSAWASGHCDQSLRCPHVHMTTCPLWSESSLGAKVILLVLSWGGSFYFASLVSAILISVISRRFISWNVKLPEKARLFFLCIHARVYLSPFILSYCRRVAILT